LAAGGEASLDSSRASERGFGQLCLPKWLRRFTVLSLCVAIGQLVAAAGPDHADHLRSAWRALLTAFLLLSVLRIGAEPDTSG
jgi:hypothetical protein